MEANLSGDCPPRACRRRKDVILGSVSVSGRRRVCAALVYTRSDPGADAVWTGAADQRSFGDEWQGCVLILRRCSRLAAEWPISLLQGMMPHRTKAVHKNVTSKRFPVDASAVVEGRAKTGHHTGGGTISPPFSAPAAGPAGPVMWTTARDFRSGTCAANDSSTVSGCRLFPDSDSRNTMG